MRKVSLIPASVHPLADGRPLVRRIQANLTPERLEAIRQYFYGDDNPDWDVLVRYLGSSSVERGELFDGNQLELDSAHDWFTEPRCLPLAPATSESHFWLSLAIHGGGLYPDWGWFDILAPSFLKVVACNPTIQVAADAFRFAVARATDLERTEYGLRAESGRRCTEIVCHVLTAACAALALRETFSSERAGVVQRIYGAAGDELREDFLANSSFQNWTANVWEAVQPPDWFGEGPSAYAPNPEHWTFFLAQKQARPLGEALWSWCVEQFELADCYLAAIGR